MSAGGSAPQGERFFENGKYPFFRTSDVGAVHLSDNLCDVRDYLNDQGIKKLNLFRKGTILFPKSGASTFLNHRVIMGCDGYVASHLATMSAGEKIDSKFLYYFLILIDAKNIAPNSSYPSLRISDIAKIKIPLPPLAEQKKIVARLEGLLGKIKEAKRLRAEAQEAAQNLLPAELYKIFTTHSISSNHSLIRANRRIVKKPASVKNYGPLRRSSSEASEAQWEEKELGEICELNPKKSEVKDRADDLLVSFVPMSAVDEYLQTITSREERNLGEVRKGYTYFRNDDVLFAKITPCMENGKVAIARNLKNGIGFGTTEFHVIRARGGVLPEWIHYIVGQPSFREIAKTRMTGSAGQKRVPVQFLEKFKIPLPPVDEQKKIVARLDSLSEKIKNLRQTQAETAENLKSLEQSVLHQAFSNSREDFIVEIYKTICYTGGNI